MADSFHLSGDSSLPALPAAARIVLLPAAGRSQRMGDHKLSLLLGGNTLLGEVLANYLAAQVDLIVIVRRPDDEKIPSLLPPSDRVVLVTPESAPEEMKTSLTYALAAIRQLAMETSQHRYLLSPPDMPFLRPSLIELLLAESGSHSDVLIPTFAGRRGHPVIFSDRIARLMDAIPPNEGLNSLWKREDVQIREIPVDNDEILFDVDTPQNYAEALIRCGK
ncbi:molybdopterin-guanine dinucleotide biosynthesis protein MobA [Polystyrenella longa]|uniref:Molybdopterin-guanine dinucleotide biosynthesis protein MobA n=1 Tax=Polystyrenella longa TaxID=2528007 RepID=A0A518CPT8_9PLAN|nr:NTP transferase domain-containing protein [Polystyrenella longa]QDU81240.1 molybdopterin-guanine dinucleotide biosynthesis protein MobA [Polystyrenella longa]